VALNSDRWRVFCSSEPLVGSRFEARFDFSDSLRSRPRGKEAGYGQGDGQGQGGLRRPDWRRVIKAEGGAEQRKAEAEARQAEKERDRQRLKDEGPLGGVADATEGLGGLTDKLTGR
jgi:hypothetical protein